MRVRMPADSIIAAYSVRTGTSAHPVSRSSFLQGTPPQAPTKGSQALSLASFCTNEWAKTSDVPSSLDRLVGARKKCWRDDKSKRLRGSYSVGACTGGSARLFRP